MGSLATALLFSCSFLIFIGTIPGTTMERRHHREKKMTEKEADENLTAKLEESGYREELKKKLIAKLEESGWRDQVKMACKDVVKEKGLDKITVEDLVQEVSPKGSQMVPEEIRKELLRDIKKFLEEQAED